MKSFCLGKNDFTTICLKILNKGVFKGLCALRLWESVLSDLCCVQPLISPSEVEVVDLVRFCSLQSHQVSELCVR